MASAAHRDLQTVSLRELHRALNVGNAGTARNERWSSIDVPVPHPPSRFVASLPASDQLTAKDLPETLKVCGVERAVIRLEAARRAYRHPRTCIFVAGLTTAVPVVGLDASTSEIGFGR
jgi:hypothetical protein